MNDTSNAASAVRTRSHQERRVAEGNSAVMEKVSEPSFRSGSFGGAQSGVVSRQDRDQFLKSIYLPEADAEKDIEHDEHPIAGSLGYAGSIVSGAVVLQPAVAPPVSAPVASGGLPLAEAGGVADLDSAPFTFVLNTRAAGPVKVTVRKGPSGVCLNLTAEEPEMQAKLSAVSLMIEQGLSVTLKTEVMVSIVD